MQKKKDYKYIKKIKYHKEICSKSLLKIPTFSRADDAGKVNLIKSSRDNGGTTRSPFLTAPFNRMVRAFGEDKILVSRGEKKK